MQVGAAGSEGETNCAGLGSQCSADASKGGGFMFSVGYMWRYIGFDVLAGGTADGGERAYLPNRGIRQTYTVERLGGMAAVRLRGQVQSEDFRGTLALGPGVAYRVVGQSDGFPEVPKDGTTYGSFAFTADINGQWRMGQHTALVVGTMLWIESAGSEATTVRSKVLARATGSSEFHLVSGTQTMLMPYIGLQFGP